MTHMGGKTFGMSLGFTAKLLRSRVPETMLSGLTVSKPCSGCFDSSRLSRAESLSAAGVSSKIFCAMPILLFNSASCVFFSTASGFGFGGAGGSCGGNGAAARTRSAFSPPPPPPSPPIGKRSSIMSRYSSTKLAFECHNKAQKMMQIGPSAIETARDVPENS